MKSKWKSETIGNLVRVASGQVDPKDEQAKHMLVVGPENLFTGGGLDKKNLHSAEELGMISGKYAFDDQAILYSKIRPNLNKVCLPDFQGLCSADMYPLWVRDKTTAHRVYMYYLLTSERFVSDASSRSFRTGLPKINRPDLESITVEIPPLGEQRKIAAILRAWDEAIENLTRLRELREKQYLGLRNYLIDWSKNQHAVKQFLKPTPRPVPKPTLGYRALSIRSHGKGTFDRFVENPESVEMETLYVAKAGDIIVNITFAWEGAVALVPLGHDGCLVSHRFPTFVPKLERVDARYLRHALRMARFTYLLGIASPGGAGRNRVLSKSEFLDLMVPLPPLDLQRRVATILDDAEKAIAAEENYLSALNRQKRGLMQKLLTGEWRVKC